MLLSKNKIETSTNNSLQYILYQDKKLFKNQLSIIKPWSPQLMITLTLKMQIKILLNYINLTGSILTDMCCVSMGILSRVWSNLKVKIREIEKLRFFFIFKITPFQLMNKNNRILEYLKGNSSNEKSMSKIMANL